jgi:hypothetical protein
LDILSTLGDAAKGAATGAALGPIGAIAGGVLGALTDVLPALGVHLFGDHGQAVAQSAIQIASAITGKTDPTPADIAALTPDQATELRVQLAQVSAQADAVAQSAQVEALKAALADVANARSATVDLAKVGSHIAWGAPAVSIMVLATFAAVMAVAMLRTLPPGSESILQMLLGSLGTMAASVVSYWVGSSAGSAAKNDLLYRSHPAQDAAAAQAPA